MNKNHQSKIFAFTFALVFCGMFSLIFNSSSASATKRNYTFTGATDYWEVPENPQGDLSGENYYVTDYCRKNRHKATSQCGNDGAKITVRRANWIRARVGNKKLECYTGEWGDSSYAGKVRRNTKLSSSDANALCAHAKYPNGAIFKVADNGKSGGSYGGYTWHFPTIFTYEIRAVDSSKNLIGGAKTGRYSNYGYCGSDNDSASESEKKIDAVKARISSINYNQCTINLGIYFDMDNNKQDIVGSPAITVPYICPATFSGTTSLASVSPSSTVKISNTVYKITGSGSDTTKAKFNHVVKRTDGNSGNAIGKVNKLNSSNWSQSANYAGANSSNTFAHESSVKNQDIAVGGTRQICEQINYTDKTYHTAHNPLSSFLESGNTLGGFVTNLGSHTKHDANSNRVCITLQRPYNFAVTDLNAEIKEQPVYAGEDVNSEFKFTTDKFHTDWGTPGTIPNKLKITAVHFLVNSNVNFDTVKTKNFTSSKENIVNNDLVATLRNFVNSRLGASNISDFSKLTDKEITSGNNGTIKVSTTTPDLTSANQSTVGYKYCVAAISDFVDFDKLSDDIETNRNKRGFVSNIECRPIAKKPYLQVENSSLYGANNIKTVNSSKIVGVKLGGTGSKTTFGSWSEYFLVANTGSIENASSGAALNKGNKENALCLLSPLTIGNSKCKSSNTNGDFGKSHISRNNFASAMVSYYSDETHKDKVNPHVSSVNSANSFGDKFVIMVDGNINITGNVIADNGNFVSSNDVSQHIIISTNGDINIDQNVENVDAWLIAPNGTIRTCTENNQEYSNDKLGSATCNKPLTINGLVAAKELSFKRTYGMETIAPNGGNFAAEKIIFNPTAYLWSYQQAASQTGQANVVYTRELAPRQ